MEKEEIKKVMNGNGSKSGKMIELYNGGMGIKEISELIGVRYNFVYNVVSNECRKNGTDVKVTRKNGTVKESIINLIKEGKNNVEISRELGKDYNYVFKVRKEMGYVKE